MVNDFFINGDGSNESPYVGYGVIDNIIALLYFYYFDHLSEAIFFQVNSDLFKVELTRHSGGLGFPIARIEELMNGPRHLMGRMHFTLPDNEEFIMKVIGDKETTLKITRL